MKKVLCLLLAVLLLSGCTQVPGGENAQPSPLDELQTIAQRRDAAESYMRKMMSIFWQVDTEMSYSFKVGSGDPTMDADKYVSTLEPGKIYSGLPYTHGAGDAETFAQFGNYLENGVLRMHSISPDLLNGSGGTNKKNNTARIGNDCADAVYAAWSRVSNSVTFPNAANMTPKYGCIPVGDYETVDETAADYGITKDMCKQNGEAVMFAAYALLQKADGLTVNTKGGAHAMLVSQVNVVKNGDEIDPEESYVLVHEQTSKYFNAGETRWEESLGQEVYVMGGVDRKYTFQKLYKAGYLPVTCQEFIDSAPLEKETVTDSEENIPLDAQTLFAGALISNYRICWVRAEIVNDQGNVLQQATCFGGGGDRNIFLLERFENPLEQPVLNGQLNLAELPKGAYTFRLVCRLSTGLEQVARTVSITI